MFFKPVQDYTLRLHYNAVLYNHTHLSSILCVKMSADDCGITQCNCQAVKIVLPVYFLAKFDTS